MNAHWETYAAACAQQGYAVAPGRVVKTYPEARDCATTLSLPLVARPVAPTGEYCAMLAEYPADTELAFSRARGQSSVDEVLFQPFMPGPLYALLASHGDDGWECTSPVAISLLDKYAMTPMSFLYPAVLEERHTAAMKAIALAGLHHLLQSPLNVVCEFVLADDRPVAVFMRAVGAVDVPLAEVLRLAKLHGAACIEYLTPQTGIVERIEGRDDVAAMEGIVAIAAPAKPGDAIRHATSIASRNIAGCVTAVARTAEEAQTRAGAAAQLLQIVTTPFA